MHPETTQRIISMLQQAYRMELETVVNYLSNSVYLDGVRAEEVKRALGEDVTEELGHAEHLARRIKQLGGRVPGSLELKFDQESLQPPQETTDWDTAIRGVVDAERAAIDCYRNIIEQTQDVDPVTADLATKLMGEEEEHRTLFEGFQRETQVTT